MTAAYRGTPRRRAEPVVNNAPRPTPTVEDFRRRKERRTPPGLRAAGMTPADDVNEES